MISDRIEIAYSNPLKEDFICRNDLENIFIGKEDIGYTHYITNSYKTRQNKFVVRYLKIQLFFNYELSEVQC